jgi:hypothetical protein
MQSFDFHRLALIPTAIIVNLRGAGGLKQREGEVRLRGHWWLP